MGMVTDDGFGGCDDGDGDDDNLPHNLIKCDQSYQ